MIRLSTDSTSDLNGLFEQNNVAVMPVCVVLGGKTFEDGIDVTPEDVYAYVKETGKLPKTSARNEYDYEEFFKELTKDGDTLIHLAFSSELSTCEKCAEMAAQKVGNVYVVDTLSLSTGSGALVMRAVDLIKQGKTAEEVVENLKSAIPHVQASFIVSTMEYLHKGGRCSGLAAFAANALKIIPTLLLKEGKIVVGKKYMGNVLKNCDRYVLDILKANNSYDDTRAFVTYTKGTDERVVNKIEETLKANSSFKEIIRTTAGSTITCHCGAGTIGILYINDKK